MAAKKSSAKKATTKRASTKRASTKRLGKVSPAPDPFREEIVIARGDNVDGHAHRVAVAHAGRGAVDTGPDTRSEAERVAQAVSASDSTTATVRRLDGKPNVRGKDGLIHGDVIPGSASRPAVAPDDGSPAVRGTAVFNDHGKEA